MIFVSLSALWWFSDARQIFISSLFKKKEQSVSFYVFILEI